MHAYVDLLELHSSEFQANHNKVYKKRAEELLKALSLGISRREASTRLKVTFLCSFAFQAFECF